MNYLSVTFLVILPRRASTGTADRLERHTHVCHKKQRKNQFKKESNSGVVLFWSIIKLFGHFTIPTSRKGIVDSRLHVLFRTVCLNCECLYKMWGNLPEESRRWALKTLLSTWNHVAILCGTSPNLLETSVDSPNISKNNIWKKRKKMKQKGTIRRDDLWQLIGADIAKFSPNKK